MAFHCAGPGDTNATVREVGSIIGKKLLVIDDDPDLQRVLTDVLTVEGATPVVAGDGATALRLAGSQLYDLVLLDLNLPDMSGWQVLMELRASLSNPPVIILTASAADASRQRALAAGAIDYVVKPVAIGQLVSLLKQRLSAGDAPTP